MNEIQDALRTWHRKKFPRSTLPEIGLKLAEECGEVCRAIDRIHYSKSATEDAQWRENLTDEIGDAAIVLLVLCNRGHLDFEEVLTERAAEVMAR